MGMGYQCKVKYLLGVIRTRLRVNLKRRDAPQYLAAAQMMDRASSPIHWMNEESKSANPPDSPEPRAAFVIRDLAKSIKTYINAEHARTKITDGELMDGGEELLSVDDALNIPEFDISEELEKILKGTEHLADQVKDLGTQVKNLREQVESRTSEASFYESWVTDLIHHHKEWYLMLKEGMATRYMPGERTKKVNQVVEMMGRTVYLS